MYTSQTQQVIPQVINKFDSLGAFDLWAASCTRSSQGVGCHSPGAADRHRVRQALFSICFVKHFLTLLKISFPFSISPLHLFVVSFCQHAAAPARCSESCVFQLKQGFKVTGLVWTKRVQFSSLGIQAEISGLQPNPWSCWGTKGFAGSCRGWGLFCTHSWHLQSVKI